MAAHVADLPVAKIAIHIPGEAVRASRPLVYVCIEIGLLHFARAPIKSDEVVFAEGCACFDDDVGAEVFMVDILKMFFIVGVALLNSAAHISYRVTIDY